MIRIPAISSTTYLKVSTFSKDLSQVIRSPSIRNFSKQLTDRTRPAKLHSSFFVIVFDLIIMNSSLFYTNQSTYYNTMLSFHMYWFKSNKKNQDFDQIF